MSDLWDAWWAANQLNVYVGIVVMAVAIVTAVVIFHFEPDKK